MEFLHNRGDHQTAQQADAELPARIDTDEPEHQNLLERLGVDPMALIERFMGGKGFDLPGR